jgi:DmsE family decaheme c-type cytochrome
MKSKTHWKTAFYGVMLGIGLAFTAQTAQAADSPAKQARLKKDAVCTSCHDESEAKPIYSIYQTRHGALGDPRTPACTDCHGDSTAHLKEVPGKGRPAPDRVFGHKSSTSAHYEPSDAQEQSDTCMGCHKGGERTHWSGGPHESNDVSCSSCHKVHSPVDKVRVKSEQTDVCFQCHKDQRVTFKKISAHPVDIGKMSCSDCHNPHGSSSEHQLRQNTVNETCFLCHADKRGPFLWEHQPVVEDCSSCHNPHGSNITPMLISRAPFLCSNCHNGPHDSAGAIAFGAIAGGRQVTGAAPNAQFAGRACMNCHVMVHGSNSPAGQGLTR